MIEGLKVAGIFLDVTMDSTPEDSNQAASVQGSVAAVIQDITGEQNSPSVNPNNSHITAPNVSVVCYPLVGAIDRPELLAMELNNSILLRYTATTVLKKSFNTLK